MKQLFFTCFTLSVLLVATKVQAYGDYEEVSYEQLLQELSRQVAPAPRQSESYFTHRKIHASLGLVGSGMVVRSPGMERVRFHDAMQVAGGFELQPGEWELELALRNYPKTDIGSENYDMTEIDVKALHKGPLRPGMGYRFGVGLAARRFRYEDLAVGYSQSTTTPQLLLSLGSRNFVSDSLSLGADLSARNSISGNAIERTSMDLTLRLDAHF